MLIYLVVVAQREYARYDRKYMVVVAQLVEPRFVVPMVAGSSPVDHPEYFRHKKCLTIMKFRTKVEK